MKTSALIVGVAAMLCLSLAACVTRQQAGATLVPFSCIVQAETEVVYELHLDGKFVSSGKTLPAGKGLQLLELTATPGDHELMVTAPGYATWQRTVTLMSGTKHGSAFRIELKKSAQ